jgi:hypothetical protein
LVLLEIEGTDSFCSASCRGADAENYCTVFLYTLATRRGKPLRCRPCLDAEQDSDPVDFIYTDAGGESTCVSIPAKDLQKTLVRKSEETEGLKVKVRRLQEKLRKAQEQAGHAVPASAGAYCPNWCRYASSLRKSPFCSLYRVYREEKRDPKWRKHKYLRHQRCLDERRKAC